MKGTKAKLDYEKMIQFSIPRRMGARPQMKIKEDGRVSISSMIIEDLLKKDGDLRVDFRHTADYKTVIIRSDEEQAFKLPKGKSFIFKEWKDNLQKLKYLIPAVYQFELNEEDGVWIGRLQEVPEAPAI